jgi:hypothetical protein
MILEGKVIKLIDVKEGTSKTSGKDWKLAQYLIDTTTNEQYPKQVVVEVFGEDRIDELSLIPDEQVKLNVEAESREFNGKWYTSVRAWGRAEDEKPAQPVQQADTAPKTQQVQPTNVEETSDLPF